MIYDYEGIQKSLQARRLEIEQPIRLLHDVGH